MASVETVTVLITDLVGSTALGSRVGPTMADALRREHFGVLREAIEASQGREVKNLGDGLMVVFASASGGLRCAVAMQQAMERRNRFAEQPLHVRIGVGAGEATVEDGDYFGMPPIEAARLCDQAGGDGILASSLARWIAARHDGLSFDSVGMLELKGIPGPVEAFQVGWEPLAEVGLPDRLTGVPEVSFVGREVERERLAQGWQAARAGRRQVVMVSGEPGIGKTRLATHAALRAHADGATVLYGRCDEDLGVAYQPWLEALRHYVSNGPKAVLREHVGANGGDVARLAPELGRRLDDVPAPQDSDPETERYLLFNAVLGLLQAAADRSPVVLVLDDLQWADRPTLVLLRHVIDHSAEVPLLIVGAFRASELSTTDPLTALLADLRREDDTVSRLALDGLGETEIVALLESVAGHELDEPGLALAAELRRETDGNPFFVGELLRNLRETGAIAQDSEGRWAVQREASKLGLPESVREVIGRRVGRLGEETRQTLAGAAVIGRDFELELLAAMSGEDEDLVLDRLDGAQAASLIVERAGQPGWFSFSHALVEHTLYEELGATRRARLHRRIAEALERQVGGDPGERIGELAHHWGQAVAPVALSKAADYAERAGRRALEQLAPDEAQRWFEQALELRAGQPESNAHRELLVLLGDAQRQAGDAGYRGTLLRAARLAEQAGDVDRQARAVLATWRGTSSLGQRDDDLVTALEAAAQALPTEDPRRAAVLSQLAAELTFSAPLERRRALADEALTIARAAGDPRLLCDVLMHHTYATWVPHAIDELAPYLKEALAIADEIGDPWLRFRAAHRACFVLEAGDLDGFDACIARMADLQQAIPQPLVRWILLFLQSPRALLAGRLEEAEALATHALEASGASADGITVFGGQLCSVRWEQGRLHELSDLIAQAVIDNPELPVLRVSHGMALCGAGDHEQARKLLDDAAADGFASTPLDGAWSTTLSGWSDLAFQLGAREAAAALYELLLPHAHIVVWNGASTSGPLARHLGRLALMLERYDEAEAHLAAASAEHERLGAPIWQAETDYLLGLTLLRRPSGDAERGCTLLRQAADAAHRHEAAGIERDAEAALAEYATA